MKRTVLPLVALLLLSGLHAELVDRIVAKVGSDIILMSDVYKQMQQMESAGVAKDLISPTFVLQQLVEQKVIFQKAQDLDIQVDDAKLQRFAERYLKQIKSRYPSEADFAADLARERLTESDLLEYLSNQAREGAMSDQLVERFVTSQVSVSDEETRAFYATTKDSLALKPLTWDLGLIRYEIKPGAETEAARLAEIRELQRRLNQGEDFAALAASASDCPSKERGGDLGFFGQGKMVKPFDDAAFALSVGEVSDVVRTQYGFHLIKVEEKRSSEVRARHILKILEPTGADSLAARATMEEVRRLFASGAQTFAELAQRYSTDPEVQKDGGVIGEFAETEFPELFAEQIKAAPVGQMTPVLEQEGVLYLFIRLRELPSRVLEYDEVQEKLRGYLFSQKQDQAYQEWIAKLVSESYVQIVE